MAKIIDFKTRKEIEIEVQETPSHDYTEQASEGSEYKNHRYTSIKEIAKLVRAKLKNECPGCKFSVQKESYSMGQSLHVSLMSGPFDAFVADSERGYAQLNEYTLQDPYEEVQESILSKEAYETAQKALFITKKFNYDDSDAMIDYFDVNFYLHLDIGKYDKSFVNTSK